MAVQVNLLPDIKQERLRAERIKQLTIGIAVSVLIAAIGVPLILFSVNQGIKFAQGRTQEDIAERTNQIQTFPDINTMLSVQANLDALPDLYHQRVQPSELLGLLPSLMPAEIRLSSLELTPEGNLKLIGFSPTFNAVQTFYTALGNAGLATNTERIEPNPDTEGYFTNLVLESASGDADEVSFSISATYAPELIDGVEDGQAE